MKLFKIITNLCIFLSFFSSPCSSYQDSEHGHGVQLSQPALSRKLKVNEVAKVMKKGIGNKDVAVVVAPSKRQDNEGFSGKSSFSKQAAKQMHQNKVPLSRKDLDDEAAELEFFTMDYRRVRRRRPVHNKSVPSSSTTP